jgi:methylmalonyl-CoA mutase N-terminal domain/subunit
VSEPASRQSDQPERPQRDRPWLMRTYSGHSSAKASNELYRTNLAKGQTGLSVAFDLPTQTGYDSDHVLARGEVGKVGVPVTSIDDMRALFDDIPLEQMNTSMTINARRCGCWRSTSRSPRSRAPTSRSSPARPRTTSSRSTSRAGPTRSRRSRRCG